MNETIESSVYQLSMEVVSEEASEEEDEEEGGHTAEMSKSSVDD